MISDRGPVFMGNFFQSLARRYDVEHLPSTAYHPQTDSQTEIMNRVLEDCLRTYVSADQYDWDRNIPMVEFAINDSVNSSTGHTPFFLNYARHPHTPLSLQFPQRRQAPMRWQSRKKKKPEADEI